MSNPLTFTTSELESLNADAFYLLAILRAAGLLLQGF